MKVMLITDFDKKFVKVENLLKKKSLGTYKTSPHYLLEDVVDFIKIITGEEINIEKIKKSHRNEER